MARPQLPALTGLRFIAALQVLLFHLYPHQPGASPWVDAVVGTGYVGVSLFFVLSGFILTYNYEDAVRSRSVAWGEFWWSRFARIYPVYLAGLLIAIPPYFLLGARPAAQTAARIAPSVGTGILAVQAWGSRTACVVNCPGWSISVEAFFYLAFPLLAVLLATLRPRALLGVAAAAWAAVLVFPVLYLLLDPDGIVSLTHRSNGYWLTRLKFTPVARLGEFVMGMAAGSLFLRRSVTTSRRGLDLLAAGLILAVLAVGPRLPYPLLHNGLLAPAFALLVYALAAGDGALSRALSRRAWAKLGGASYAMYIIHVPMGNWMLVLYRAVGVTPHPLVKFALAGAASFLAALVLFEYLEEPARRWLRGVPARLRLRRAARVPALAVE
jgi:peptidoglycan/LPS O-acetylase OafA/YrhL